MTSHALITKLHAAFNSRDIDSLMDCFAEDYSSEQPVYPDRAFMGPEQVRKNWSANFEEMPDFTAVLLRYDIGKECIWMEWDWQGTRLNNTKLHMCGVTLFGVKENKINWSRLYMEPVKTDGRGIDAAVKEVMHGKK